MFHSCLSYISSRVLSQPVSAFEDDFEDLIENMDSWARFECPSSFFAVGDRCVLVNPFLDGTWDESRFYCKTLGADMVQIDTWQFYLDLLDFLMLEGARYNNHPLNDLCTFVVAGGGGGAVVAIPHFSLTGLEENSYWLGARDEAKEGTWLWEVGGQPVTMGSPFWSLYFKPGDIYYLVRQ